MRANLLISILIVLLSIKVPAQFNPGAKQIALSNSDIALSNDVFALFSNPAGLAQMNWQEIGIFYSPAPFGLSELANGFAAFNQPTSFGSFSLGFMTYGFELYRENKFLFSYSNNFNKRLFYGASIRYHSIKIKNYGNAGTISFLAGALVYLTDYLRLGFSIDNPTRASIGSGNNQLPLFITSGISYSYSNALSLNLALQKETDLPASVRFGIDYSIIKYLSLRIGIDNEPKRYSTGIGINYEFINFDYAVFTHSDLGLTHQFGLIIHFGKNTPRTERIKSFINPDKN